MADWIRPTPADGKNIKCKVLALAGADDPFQKPEDLTAFESEMRDSKVDWQIVFYGGAVHAFTQPNPGFVNAGRKIQRKGRQAFVGGDEEFLRRDFSIIMIQTANYTNHAKRFSFRVFGVFRG